MVLESLVIIGHDAVKFAESATLVVKMLSKLSSFFAVFRINLLPSQLFNKSQ